MGKEVIEKAQRQLIRPFADIFLQHPTTIGRIAG